MPSGNISYLKLTLLPTIPSLRAISNGHHLPLCPLWSLSTEALTDALLLMLVKMPILLVLRSRETQVITLIGHQMETGASEFRNPSL